jgi:hypothetical protein
LSPVRVKREGQPGFLYRDVPVTLIVSFIRSFINHPASQLTEQKPILDYVGWLQGKGLLDWDVVVISLSKNQENTIELHLQDQTIISQRRTVSYSPGNGVEFNKRRVASRGHEKAGLLEEDISEAESEYKLNNPDKKNIPDSVYRGKRNKPLLMLHVFDCRKQEDPEISLFPEGIIAYGISFPGMAGSRRPERLVEYIVNTVWWDSNYGELLDEEDEIFE